VGAYAQMYHRTQLASPRRYLALPGAPAPDGWGPVYAGEYAKYLEGYASERGISVKKRTVVLST
jgi:cation diffusion facilitator CzcD-associated flavoprotein CzcO